MEKLLLVNVKELESTYCFIAMNHVVKKVRELSKDLTLSDLSSEAGIGKFSFMCEALGVFPQVQLSFSRGISKAVGLRVLWWMWLHIL